MDMMAKYQDAIEWIGDMDDTTFVTDCPDMPSVTVCMVADLWGKPVETVITDLRKYLETEKTETGSIWNTELKLMNLSEALKRCKHGHERRFGKSVLPLKVIVCDPAQIQCFGKNSGKSFIRVIDPETGSASDWWFHSMRVRLIGERESSR